MGDNQFSVYQFFPDDSCEAVVRFVDAKTAVLTAARLTNSIGSQIGTTRRVIITNGDDCCCFEWKWGEGVTFPRREEVNGHG